METTNTMASATAHAGLPTEGIQANTPRRARCCSIRAHTLTRRLDGAWPTGGGPRVWNQWTSSGSLGGSSWTSGCFHRLIHKLLQPLLRAGESFPDRRHRLAQNVSNLRHRQLFPVPQDQQDAVLTGQFSQAVVQSGAYGRLGDGL